MCVLLGGTEVPVLTDSTRKARNVKHIALCFQIKRCIICFLPRVLGMEVANNLVVPVLPAGPGHT